MNEAMIGVLTVLAVIAWIVLILVVIYFFLVFPGRTRRALQASFLGHWYSHRGFTTKIPKLRKTHSRHSKRLWKRATE
ncbi:MAG: hypothetical protein J6U42_03595 [Lachnospiraceae bacterium]|nr:hypothetical protein [Lachnospiraceae bacterium]